MAKGEREVTAIAPRSSDVRFEGRNHKLTVEVVRDATRGEARKLVYLRFVARGRNGGAVGTMSGDAALRTLALSILADLEARHAR